LVFAEQILIALALALAWTSFGWERLSFLVQLLLLLLLLMLLLLLGSAGIRGRHGKRRDGWRETTRATGKNGKGEILMGKNERQNRIWDGIQAPQQRDVG
jgi:membrane protein implicated in regulation of membrane protease activity